MRETCGLMEMSLAWLMRAVHEDARYLILHVITSAISVSVGLSFISLHCIRHWGLGVCVHTFVCVHVCVCACGCMSVSVCTYVFN